MNKIPDSDTSEEDDDENMKVQLTKCGLKIGEGTLVYLMMMKTFTILFLILSIINFPLFFSYSNSTSNNNMTLKQMWKYFTVGNIGNTDNNCAWSSLDLVTLDHEMNKLEFECPEGFYINELKYFGFLYAMDYRFNIESYGESFCLKAE